MYGRVGILCEYLFKIVQGRERILRAGGEPVREGGGR
jgi:hypothetical protein